jgi:Predicted Zn peptidase
MSETNNSGSPEQAIIQKAQGIVKCALKEGWTGPPFDPSILASILGIRKTAIDNIDGEAQIISINNQFELMFRKDVADKRLNFTLCHEISHTLFPDCAQMIRFRNTNRAKFDPEREVEFLCDIGAAEMLLPSPFFENDFKLEGISLRSVNKLSDQYNASREAIIRRIPSTNLEPCAVVYLGLGFNKEELKSFNNPDLPFDNAELAKPQPKIRIRKVHASESFRTFLPRNKSVPNNSKLYDLLTGEEYISTTEAWDISGFGKRHIEAVRLYNYVKSNRLGILALVH